MYGKREDGEGVVAIRPARPARHGESYTARIPVLRGCSGHPEVERLHASAVLCRCHIRRHEERRWLDGNRPRTDHRLMKPGKRTNGTPTPRYNVQRQRTTGSPKGRKAQGDGVPIVVKRVKPLHVNEGEQVTKMSGKKGTRDA